MSRLCSAAGAVREPPLQAFAFYLFIFFPGQKKQPSIIGRVFAFDAKIYKNVGGIFNVSSCQEWNKKIFQHIKQGVDLASQKLANERGACPDAKDAGINEICPHLGAGFTWLEFDS